MAKIEILNFNKFGDIPAHIRKHVRPMHYHYDKNDFWGGESHLDEAIRHNKIVNCHVLMVDGVPAGWYARFTYDKYLRNGFEFGFWVAHKYRGKGYGRLLVVHSVKTYPKQVSRTEYFNEPCDWIENIKKIHQKCSRKKRLLTIAKEQLLKCSPDLCSVV